MQSLPPPKKKKFEELCMKGNCERKSCYKVKLIAAKPNASNIGQ